MTRPGSGRGLYLVPPPGLPRGRAGNYFHG